VQRLNSIVEQFLSLARPIEIKAEALPLAAVLKELAALEDGEAKRSQVQIRVVTAPNLPPLKADPRHLTQVLLNLMLNGLQAMPHGGTLTLEATASSSNFLIAVTDTGTGIAPENLPRIFEPYFTTKTQGSGLGLAISRRIIEAHGGTITAAAGESGVGCRFEISLPRDGVKV
jgi:signal transduction histidine kinase